MLGTLASVALGGALGASLRYLAGVAIFRLLGPSSFPVAILSVNVVGSFLMGIFVVLAAQRGLTYLSPFIMTGLLGGFTTFSAFSLEAVTLYERGDVTHAVLYVALSVGLSIAGLMAGLLLARGLLS
ncbi:MAG: fluoride efflux transporter CrcB [Silicimonas sp.]|nr:fluoride efflux transporter CrcB [Silicimonas sp.]